MQPELARDLLLHSRLVKRTPGLTKEANWVSPRNAGVPHWFCLSPRGCSPRSCWRSPLEPPRCASQGLAPMRRERSPNRALRACMHRRTRYSDKKAHRVHAGGLEVLWTRSTHGTSQGSIRRALSATLLPANLDPNPITASRRQALTTNSFDGRPHARRRAAPSLWTAAMASALAMPPTLAPSPIASCTGRVCLARALSPMRPSRSRKTAMLWASGSFRPKRCGQPKPQFHPACVATRPRRDSHPQLAPKPRIHLECCHARGLTLPTLQPHRRRAGWATFTTRTTCTASPRTLSTSATTGTSPTTWASGSQTSSPRRSLLPSLTTSWTRGLATT